MPNNLERMLTLVGEFFDVKNDPEQISVDEEVMAKLKALHPDTLSEICEDDGPVLWILLIPTTIVAMEQFIKGDITEQQLLDLTTPGDAFEAIYLCSASVLPEFRGKGMAKNATINAIHKMQDTFQVKALYFWKFSDEGAYLAYAVGKDVNLPVYARE